MTAEAPARACPRTGRTRAMTLEPGAIRPSDTLTAFLGAGVAWLLVAAVTAVAYALGGPFELRWLALHFAFVGGVSQLIIGAAQFFACAFLATEPPARGTIRAELVLWNAATASIAIGVTWDVIALTGAGGVLVLAGLLVFDRELRAMRRRSIQRVPWATRWYRTAALFLGCGAVLGPAMANATAWPRGSLLGAHLALNIGGWFGTAIVGTLHTFHPSLTGTRLRFPRLQAPTYAAWTGGIALVAFAAAWNADAASIAGWALLAAAAGMLTANLAAGVVGGGLPSPAAVIVTAGQVLLGAAVVAGLATSLRAGPIAGLVGTQRATLVLTLLAGWIGLTVCGSLLHLLGLMARVRRHRRPVGAPGGDPIALAGAALVVVAIALCAESAGAAGRIVLATGYVLLLARVAVLAATAVRAAPLRIWRDAP